MLDRQAYQSYQNNAVNTASGPQLTLMLYNGCIKFIQQGIQAIQQQNYEGKNIAVQKAQDIIQELMLTLDQDIEISQQLLPLYDFIHYQLQQGNMKNDVAPMEEALALVNEFRDVWKEVMKQNIANHKQGARA